MFADGGGYDGCSLTAHFVHEDVGHYLRVGVVEMGDGFVDEDEVERLAEGTNHGYALLLAEGHATDETVFLIGNAEAVEPVIYLKTILKIGKTVFYQHILHGGKFGEQTQFLPEE